MATKRTHYEVLGVSPQATEKEIKTAYRQKARETHPDFGGTVEAASAVNEAADVLLDPQKRAGYDYDLAKARSRGTAAGTSSGGADPFTWTRTPPKPPGPTVEECPHCGAKNRVKPGALDEAKCGACKKPLKDSLGAIFSDWVGGFGERARNPLKTVDELLAQAEAKLRETRENLDKRSADRVSDDPMTRAQSRLDDLDDLERKINER